MDTPWLGMPLNGHATIQEMGSASVLLLLQGAGLQPALNLLSISF